MDGRNYKPILCAFLFITSPLFAHDAYNLIENGTFESGLSGWSALWTREAGLGNAAIETGDGHNGTHSLKITHRGTEDWSFGHEKRFDVIPGEVYESGGWVKCSGMKSRVQLSVVTRDHKGTVLDWLFGITESGGTHDWETISRRFIVPSGCSTIQFRITGKGTGTCRLDDLFLVRCKEAPDPSTIGFDLPAVIESGGVSVSFHPPGYHMALRFGESSPAYRIDGFGSRSFPLKIVKEKDRLLLGIRSLYGPDISAEIAISDSMTVTFSIRGDGRLDTDFPFPGSILAGTGESWVIPSNEGLLIPADDRLFHAWRYDLSSGHSGLCMPFIGLTDGGRGITAVCETPDDAHVEFRKPDKDGTSGFAFGWKPQKGAWGYERKIRFRYVPENGYVGIAKAYRQYAAANGLLATLKEKRDKVPAVDLLVGAADVWWWKKAEYWSADPDCGEAARELKNAGMEKVLWSNKASPEAIRTMNDIGFLTGSYDIYQDVWDPSTPVSWLNKEGWPEDLVLLPDGTRRKGWVHRENGKEYPGGVICSKRGLKRMKTAVAVDLEDHAYRARFIDTTTASPLIECYHPDHPLTRSDDRRYKSMLLNHVSSVFKLVTGSETGVDWAVPYLHYFEGMMSLAHYRLPDAGYDLTSYIKPHREFLRYQVGPFYRIPLFELVYHDCVSSFWYWGDSSNRIPQVWDIRDLFNILYGTGPLYIMDDSRWQKDKMRFIRSYKRATGVFRRTGYDEMLEHRFISPDHLVQYTAFSGETEVWVNFSDRPYRLQNGNVIGPFDYLIVDSKARPPG
ncbi:MAG: carbohydrate binding domain-containing protein [Spirochaetales bacterium]|nr:carbohydrate binding domain-containing protein [Spirochaetales bacterium]